jgi:DMSO/TMAO reductase YedYZ molybdopterin-dependent catalytic subunit
MPPPSRRDLLRAAPLAALPFLAPRAFGQAPPSANATAPTGGLTVRMHEPRNLETPVGQLATGPNLLTNTDQFYVRSHFALPTIDLKNWKLRIEGHVESPLEFTLDDLKNLPTVKKTLTIECAGNGRVFLAPAVRGLQWGFGGVGTAEWNGILLASILEKAKPKPGATDVVLIGADKGAVTTDPASPGPVHFDRGIPLNKAMKPETILAWGMNGQDLTPAHGYPLRAVVGGWYGMAAVKWLTRIVVTDQPYAGFWQTFDYSYFRRVGELPVLAPVSVIQPKAIITSLAEGTEVKFGSDIPVSGLAWSGEAAAKLIDFSDDGGATWQTLELNPKADPFVWQAWSISWKPKQKGTVKLLVRCTDTTNATMPTKRDGDRRSYMINHLVPVEVLVR